MRRCFAVVLWVGFLLTPGARADAEKVLNIYNWGDYIGPDTVAEFTRETGIKVNYDRYDSTTVVEARLMAGRTGYDLVLQAMRYSARLIPLGVFQPLDKSKLPLLGNQDPWVMSFLARGDPGNRYAIPYMWGSTGFIYNVKMIHDRMPDAPVDSAAMLFDPAVASHFADCGISLLESSTTVIPLVLQFLGRDPNSMDQADLDRAERQLQSVRPYIRYISSSQMLNDLTNQDVCIAMAWSGDYGQAMARLREVGLDLKLAYTAPREGSLLWFDTWLIPADAPHPENALKFLNYLMRPQVMAAISDAIGYANANLAARALMDPAVANDPVLYPPLAQRHNWDAVVIHGPKLERRRSRAWSRFKTGL